MATMLSRLKALKRENDCFFLVSPTEILKALPDSQPVVAFRTETDHDWETWEFFLGHILSDEVIFNRLCELAKQEDHNLKHYGCIKGPDCECHAAKRKKKPRPKS
jgi:hypothetical protein